MTMEYKGYHASILKSKIYTGKIKGIEDLVLFECESLDELEQEFHKSVDDYLQFCKEVGKEPEKGLL